MGNSEQDRAAITQRVEEYYQTFQSGSDSDLLKQVILPVVFWLGGRMTGYCDEKSLLEFRESRVKAFRQTGFGRGVIRDMEVNFIGENAAMTEFRAIRLSADDEVMSEVQYALILFKDEGVWKVSIHIQK